MDDTANILIFRRGRKIGDTIVALPCFHKIAATFPQARRILLTTREIPDQKGPIELLLNGTNLIHSVITYEAYLRNPFQLLRLRKRLIAENIRYAVYLPENRSYLQLLCDVAFLRLCGIELLCSPLELTVRWNHVDSRTGFYEREFERLARLLAPLGPLDLANSDSWNLHLTQREIGVACNFLEPLADRPFVAINVGGALRVQRWEDKNWAEVIGRLQTILPSLALVFFGSADDAGRANELSKSWKGPVLNACGLFSPRESAAILAQAYMFLGHDSGPMQLAASCGVHCVVLFGNHNLPGHWYPYGKGHEIVRNSGGIEKISTDDVVSAVQRFVESHPIPASNPKSRIIANGQFDEADIP